MGTRKHKLKYVLILDDFIGMDSTLANVKSFFSFPRSSITKIQYHQKGQLKTQIRQSPQFLRKKQLNF